MYTLIWLKKNLYKLSTKKMLKNIFKAGFFNFYIKVLMRNNNVKKYFVFDMTVYFPEFLKTLK